MKRIVVGVDGSRSAQQALEWAVRTAAARGARLTVFHAYPVAHADHGFVPSDVDVRDAAEALVAAVIERLGPLPEGVGLESRVRPVREGNVAKAVIDEAAGADLLVVGSRGLGGFMALLVGSVGQQCLAHAPCPVVVVPPPRAVAATAARRAREPVTAEV